MLSSVRFAHAVVCLCGFALFLPLLLPGELLAATPRVTAGFVWSQAFRPDTWQPVRLELSNDGDEAIDGAVVLPLTDPRGPASMRLPVTVPPRSRVRTSVWGYFPAREVTAKQRRDGRVPPLAVVEWRDRGNALVGRDELLGVQLGEMIGEEVAGESGELVLLIDRRAQAAGTAAYDLYSLLTPLNESSGVALAVAAIEPAALARDAPGLRPLKAIVLEGVDPDVFDLAQREMLRQYVVGGGVLVLSAPIEAVGQAGNSLSSLFPVRLVGTRMAKEIKTAPDGPALKLREPLEIVEAVEGGGKVLLGDRDYVHVAVRSFGLGKVVFTSFPINGLDEKQPQVALLWEQLLDLRRPQWEWKSSQLADAQHALLAGMIGRKVAPWGLAAAVAGGYLAVILAAQVMFFGPARPRAFVVSVAAALLVSGILLGMGVARRGSNVFQAARLSVIDVSGDGGGWQQETLAYVGADDPDMALETASEKVTIRPAHADATNPPTITQPNFRVDKAAVYGERIERIWEAAAPLDPSKRFDARGRFGPDGLTIEIDNGLGAKLSAPLLVCRHRAMSLPADVPDIRSTVKALALNSRDDFTNAAVLTSDQAKHRGQMIKASLMPRNESASPLAQGGEPLLIGWLEGADAAPPLVRPAGREGVEPKSMVMARTPLRIEAAAVGTKISVPAPLVSIDTGRLLYDTPKGETVPSQEVGNWLVGFAAPPQVGQIRPTRVMLEMRVSLPAHAMSVRRSQCADGKPRSNHNGALVADWKREVGLRKVSFDCAAGDYDSDGRVWLMIEIAPEGAPSGGTPVPWQMKDLSLAMEAEVVAPPKPIALEPPARPAEQRE